jgi:DNA polymerase I-like protein with 3'-5' exonuclease and polymerase domains
MAGTPEQLIICTGSKLYITRAQNIKPLLENPAVAKCGFGLKDLFLQLRQEGIIPAGILWDPSLMHYLLSPEQSHRPEDLSVRYLDILRLLRKSRKKLFDDQSVTTTATFLLSQEARLPGILRNRLPVAEAEIRRTVPED